MVRMTHRQLPTTLSQTNMTTQRFSLACVAILTSIVILTNSACLRAQESPESPMADAPTAETASDSDATTPAAAAADATAPAAGADSTSEPATAAETSSATSPDTEAAKSPDAADAAAAEGGFTWGMFQMVLILLALFIIPIFVGNFIGNSLRMPEYGWKIAVVLAALGAATAALYMGEFKGGPDLSGGITLIYELVNIEPGSQEVTDEQAPDARQARGLTNVKMNDMIAALKNRIDPAGTKEVVIRSSGNNAIEVIIPNMQEDDLEYVKRLFTEMGNLEFRITADSRRAEDQDIIEAARRLPPEQKILTLSGRKTAEWLELDRGGEFDLSIDTVDHRGLVKRLANGRAEGLVLIDSYNVTGDFLSSASKSFDQLARPIVRFSFDSEGSQRFGGLTGDNVSSRGQERYLGIVLDKRLISAPSIRSRIFGSGEISGISDEREVDHIVEILNAGKLPAELSKEPNSESVTSATLGLETVRKGAIAIVASMIAVLLFMIFYYRFAGMVACLALIANLVLTVATIVLIGAHFTLPGLAGLVLTIGMSVDANVLIFERIREELDRGAALRMAIRNGFARASTTIIDSNVTTLITGLVLYVVGTDQLRGFAITLMIGIVMSMFTAIFCSRILFDIAEKHRWITRLQMMRILSHTNYDFMKLRGPAIVASLVLIAVGLVATFKRGQDLLDIDFTGGTSVTMVFKDDVNLNYAEVYKQLVEKTDLEDANLQVVARGTDNRSFTVDTSIDSVDEVKRILEHAFEGQLKTFVVEVRDVAPYTAGDSTGTQATLVFGDPKQQDAGITYDALRTRLKDAMKAAGQEGIEPVLNAPGYEPGSMQRMHEWNVKLGLPEESAKAMLDGIADSMNHEPVFPLANKIGSRVAGDLQLQAILATVISLAGVMGYIWLRFQNFAFSLAAVVSLVHDVLIMIGLLALSAYFVQAVPSVASLLQIDSFQIGLSVLAAILTLIGYSLNDTIVTFDRIREVKGKSPRLTRDMINQSINQTLSRTLLTFFTTFLVVLILYMYGGPGIHAFSFALLIGLIVGTYSSVFIAAPILLWISGDPDAPSKQS